MRYVEGVIERKVDQGTGKWWALTYTLTNCEFP